MENGGDMEDVYTDRGRDEYVMEQEMHTEIWKHTHIYISTMGHAFA